MSCAQASGCVTTRDALAHMGVSQASPTNTLEESTTTEALRACASAVAYVSGLSKSSCKVEALSPDVTHQAAGLPLPKLSGTEPERPMKAGMGS